jgi:hypothetical protein
MQARCLELACQIVDGDDMQIVEKAATKARLYLAYSLVNLRRFANEVLRPRAEPSSDTEAFKRKGLILANLASMPGVSARLRPVIDELRITGEIRDPAYTVIGINERGVKAVAVDINAEFLWDHVLTKELYDLIHGYYGREFYLRNNPTIEFSYDGEVNDAQKFHLDWGLQQISVMVNLSDVSPASTHMAYLAGSNREYYFSQLHRDSDRCKRLVANCSSAHPDNHETTVGDADSAFVFDAGNGLHRQVAGGERIMLHLNFVENLAFTYWDPAWHPSANSGAYWFSGLTEATQKRIEQAGLPRTLFDLITKKSARKFGVPQIYRQGIPSRGEQA